MKKTIHKLATAIICLAMAANAQAASLYCNGAIAELSYHQGAGVMLRMSNMNYAVFICSTDSEWIVPGTAAGNTSVSACKTMYGTLLAAKLSGVQLTQMLFDGDIVPAACNLFAPWSRVNVRYFNFGS